MHQFDLKNRTAIITGGAQGFGFDIAKRFLSSGAKVIIWDIDKNELLKASTELNNSNLSNIENTSFKDVVIYLWKLRKIFINLNIGICINGAVIAGFMVWIPEWLRRTFEVNIVDAGLIYGLASALGFSIFSVSLRWRKETPKFTTVAFAGIFCAITAAIVLFNSNSGFISSSYNEGLFAVHGTLVCLGLILYSIGSKAIPAAELTLLSLTEVIGGIFWVWLPLLGINEVPTNNTIIGGFLIFMAIIYYSLTIKTNRRFIALN